MKNWLINKLGGITNDEFEKFRIDCEDEFEKFRIDCNDEFEKFRIDCENWAMKNLTVKDEAYLACDNKILVIKSNVSINNTVEKTIKLAPWVRGLRLTNCCGLYFE